jgi:hypothetical protein
MRSLAVVVLAAALAAACAPTAKSTCETRPDGVRLFVDPDAAAYGDVVEALRRDPQRMVASPPAGGALSSSKAFGPLICKTDRPFARTVHIQYPSRDQRHVGAFLDLYLDEGGRVGTAEFYVMLLAP